MQQAKQDTAALQEKSKELKASVLKAEEEAKAADAARDKAVMPIGNLVHDSVPISNDEVGLAQNTQQHGCSTRQMLQDCFLYKSAEGAYPLEDDAELQNDICTRLSRG